MVGEMWWEKYKITKMRFGLALLSSNKAVNIHFHSISWGNTTVKHNWARRTHVRLFSFPSNRRGDSRCTWQKGCLTGLLILPLMGRCREGAEEKALDFLKRMALVSLIFCDGDSMCRLACARGPPRTGNTLFLGVYVKAFSM